MLKAGVDLAMKLGARMVEGYPVEPKKNPMPDVFAWTGIASAFRKAGFQEVARRSPMRPVMRFDVRLVGSLEPFRDWFDLFCTAKEEKRLLVISACFVVVTNLHVGLRRRGFGGPPDQLLELGIRDFAGIDRQGSG